ncbi:unnamed protein product [Prorocentrum cordatum]|uniref:Uncharacterized protein n=1 Tax=Prorocentrum cordatum TaxID=2364126 RepID=A0ABN9WZQ5_9DINO|nr:unnamed protein product [Polarella glacialis]
MKMLEEVDDDDDDDEADALHDGNWTHDMLLLFQNSSDESTLEIWDISNGVHCGRWSIPDLDGLGPEHVVGGGCAYSAGPSMPAVTTAHPSGRPGGPSFGAPPHVPARLGFVIKAGPRSEKRKAPIPLPFPCFPFRGPPGRPWSPTLESPRNSSQNAPRERSAE